VLTTLVSVPAIPPLAPLSIKDAHSRAVDLQLTWYAVTGSLFVVLSWMCVFPR
jgi:hypothetical protein